MESIVNSIKKSFASLDENERIECLYDVVNEHNSDLGNSKFLQLKAPLRYGSVSFERPYRNYGYNYRGTCVCGHSSTRHWFIHGNFRDCKSCDCEGFYE